VMVASPKAVLVISIVLRAVRGAVTSARGTRADREPLL
jgi:hypothetical protein